MGGTHRNGGRGAKSASSGGGSLSVIIASPGDGHRSQDSARGKKDAQGGELLCAQLVVMKLKQEDKKDVVKCQR